ncbi:MAG: hypothetical protein K2X38_00765 [Gemmataceae bacterium]|nr:hypothetical protein [Gemmataceae bacterium]
MNAPQWLTQRLGSLKLGTDNRTWYVIFDGKPHYKLATIPAGNAFSCSVHQTENGVRIPSEAIQPNSDAALAGGLEDLRKSLGWE